jgi:hypothetical protein
MLQRCEVTQAVLALVCLVPCKGMEKRGLTELFLSCVLPMNLVAKEKIPLEFLCSIPMNQTPL